MDDHGVILGAVPSQVPTLYSLTGLQKLLFCLILNNAYKEFAIKSVNFSLTKWQAYFLAFNTPKNEKMVTNNFLIKFAQQTEQNCIHVSGGTAKYIRRLYKPSNIFVCYLNGMCSQLEKKFQLK